MRRSLSRLHKTASIIPIPMNLGQPNLGLDQAPTMLIEHGLPSMLGDLGWRVKQNIPIVVDPAKSALGEVPAGMNAKNCGAVGNSCRIIDKLVSREAEGANVPIILGGDHCISIGTVGAICRQKGNIGVIWVDAHADINTPQLSHSGNMHGMPVAFMMGLVEGAAKLPGFEWFEPCITPKDIVYIGLRDVDHPEKIMINDLGILAFTMHDIDRLGIGKVMEETLHHFAGRDVHLSFDIDAIDPFYAPHTGTAVTGGLTYREGNYICEAINDYGKLVSMELVEFDPHQHGAVDPRKTMDVALKLIGSAMGQRILRMK